MKIVTSDKAPRPIGPYSQGICIDGWLYVSGQIPIDPSTGELIEGDFKDMARRVLDNIKAILEASGGSMDNVVKMTVFLRDINQIKILNEVYSEYFHVHLPARSVVEVSNIPRGSPLEIDAVAYIGKCQ